MINWVRSKNIFQKFFIWAAFSLTVGYFLFDSFYITETKKTLSSTFRGKSPHEISRVLGSLDAIRNNSYEGKQVWEFSKVSNLSDTGKILIAVTVIGSGLLIFSGKNRL
jgi:hypothetical protein|tara:strand:+ start:33 stop:359 length:327 start_codon:yes stop_codon:yes gene_type:complete